MSVVLTSVDRVRVGDGIEGVAGFCVEEFGGCGVDFLQLFAGDVASPLGWKVELIEAIPGETAGLDGVEGWAEAR